MRTKIGILGHYGNGQNLLNGQTVKTKIITEELKSRFGQDQVLTIDTHGGLKTLLKSPLHVFQALKNSTNIVIFPAHNGLRVYAPLLAFQKHFFKNRKIHYVVIGGWLPDFILHRKQLSNVLKKFDGIYVETNTMKSSLDARGFKNVFVMPNCKQLKILSEDELIYPASEPYKLCTFSRVMKEKGIETALNAVRQANNSLGRTIYSLDIYGQIDESQIEWFNALQHEFPPYVRYCGVIPFNESINILKDYFALLFPTFYEGEGFAGTLIDAFSAGVPVIASDWKYNPELVNDNLGYVYDTKNQVAFVNILKDIAANPDLLLRKKQLCLKEAEKYKIENAIQILINQIEGNKI